MNFALPTLAVFLLLLPGFTARSRIKRVERLVLDYSPFGIVVAEALVWAAALHGVWLALAWGLAGRTLAPEVLLGLFASDARLQAAAVQRLAADAAPVAAYLVSLLALSFLLPAALRAWVVRRRWDRQGHPLSRWLRFSGAPWYYLLSAADYDADQQPDLIAVSALVNVAGQPWLFQGLLEDYFLDPEGRLDRLVLSQVQRRPMQADKDPQAPDAERFYAVDGDYFVLRYAEAITLNVEYIRLRGLGITDDQPA